VLQSARSTSVAEANGRAAIYLPTTELSPLADGA